MSHSSLPEIYVSTDVEVDGPIPGPHHVLMQWLDWDAFAS